MVARTDGNNPNVHPGMNGYANGYIKNEMLIHAITWEKCEYIMLSETSQSQKDSTVRFHLC